MEKRYRIHPVIREFAMEYNQARTEYLEKLGYKVIRFTNNDVRYNINEVISEIIRVVEKRLEKINQV